MAEVGLVEMERAEAATAEVERAEEARAEARVAARVAAAGAGYGPVREVARVARREWWRRGVAQSHVYIIYQ